MADKRNGSSFINWIFVKKNLKYYRRWKKKARKLKLNVERCRAYRNRKKIAKVLSVTTIGTSSSTLEDFEGPSETKGNINQEGK